MFNDDITPEAVHSLCAELAVMLAVEDAASSTRGPRARVKASADGRSVSMLYMRDLVFVDVARSCYAFDLGDFLRVLVQLDDGGCAALFEHHGGRMLRFESDGDLVHVVRDQIRAYDVPGFKVTMSHGDLRRGFARAGLAVR